MSSYDRYEFDGPYCNDMIACRGCEETEEKLDSIKYYLEGVVNTLYGREKFNEADLDHCLQELCCSLDISFPRQELQIVPKTIEKIVPGDFKSRFIEMYL